jgi:hypothetical protein
MNICPYRSGFSLNTPVAARLATKIPMAEPIPLNRAANTTPHSAITIPYLSITRPLFPFKTPRKTWG